MTFLNQWHHKIFTTLSVTVPQSLQTIASKMPSQFSSQFNTNIFLCFLLGQEEYWKHNLLCLSVTDPNSPVVYFFLFKEMKLSRKYPLREKHSLFFWWERSHYRQWQAHSEFATISADDLARCHRALEDRIWEHFSLPVLQSHCANKCSHTALRVINYPTDIGYTAQRVCNTIICNAFRVLTRVRVRRVVRE